MKYQQNWLTKMSNTAHQREIADLEAAGHNPILSVMGGEGASTPSAGLGSVNAPDYGIDEGITSAVQLGNYYTQKKLADSDANLKNVQAETEKAKQENFEADSDLKRMQSAVEYIKKSNLPNEYKKRFENMTADTIAKLTQVKAMKAETELKKAEKKYTNERSRGFSTKIGPLSHEGNSILGSINPYKDGKWIEETDKKGRKYKVYKKY